jgi:hypothetical protein
MTPGRNHPFAVFQDPTPARDPARNTQCPWCTRWFKGQRGLDAHLRSDADCSWVASTSLEAARNRLRRELEALRRFNAERYGRAEAGLLDLAQEFGFVRDSYRALRLAKKVSEAEFYIEAETLVERMARTGADWDTIVNVLRRAGVPNPVSLAGPVWSRNRPKQRSTTSRPPSAGPY